MTQEDKELLIKDLYTRVPYGVICLIHNVNGDDYNRSIIGDDIDLFSHHLITLKPYLRPMSSMTEEEVIEYNLTKAKYIVGYPTFKSFDWLNAHHFDYRGLIERGLAIEVTKENNPYEK